MTQAILIDTIEKMNEFRQTIAGESIVALDTEFHSEKRYFPELMLLQIANEKGDIWIIDPLKVPLAPLGKAMRHLTIVTHGGDQDITILDRNLELRPAVLFDTQIAAGFLGLHYPMGLDRLLQHRLGVEISKNETMADWSKRPLQSKQIEYAANDVRNLLALYHNLCAELKTKNRLEWVLECCKEMMNSQLHPEPVGLSWLHWGVAETLDLDSQRILANVLEWRDEIAQKKDQSPNYLLPKNSILHIAKSKPNHIQAIHNRSVHPAFLQKYGKELIKVVQEGLKDTDVFEVPSAESKKRNSIIRMWVKIYGEEIGINEDLLLSSKISHQVNFHGLDAIQGWRRDLYLDALQNFLQGKTGIFCENDTIVLKSTQI